MPAIINWFLRLLPTNPICMRLVQGGSRRMRHLYIRIGYLGVMIGVLLLVMFGSGGGASMRELAQAGASIFRDIAYLQVGLICLLTPVFMAGAIAQEANPQTWDIMLTTPLNSLQIVLGNLFGRLFFVLALLFSTLPLFLMTQYFGGVPGESIFASYAIAGASSLVVAAVAVMLSVTRTAGRRAVFVFYVTVVMYLFATYAADWMFRQPAGAGGSAFWTTAITPLNPFLALEVLLNSNTYLPRAVTQSEVGWLYELWFARPVSAYCWLCVWLSLILIVYSTARLRAIGTRVGTVPWYRRLLRLGARGAAERPARTVGTNPIAWRESVARGNTLMAIMMRWGFVAAGVAVGVAFLILFHMGSLTPNELRILVGITVGAEIVIIALVALNMSATAVSREREDGTLDIILTTPIQPGPYLSGKLRGLIQFLVPLMLVPTLTILLLAAYVLMDGFGNSAGVIVNDPHPKGAGIISVPLVLAVGAIALPIALVPFIAFCVMVGLHWSIRSKGTIGSVIMAVAVVLVVAGLLSLCAFGASAHLGYVGPVSAPFSPVILVWALVNPVQVMAETVGNVPAGSRLGFESSISLFIGAILAAAAYVAVVLGMHSTMKRSFMMTVRRLAGAS